MSAGRRFPLEPYTIAEGRKFLGAIWVLENGKGRKLACMVSTHRQGWQLRLLAGRTFQRAYTCRTAREVDEISISWRTEAQSKGWITEINDPMTRYLSGRQPEPPRQ